jgi:hypothetical protein
MRAATSVTSTGPAGVAGPRLGVARTRSSKLPAVTTQRLGRFSCTPFLLGAVIPAARLPIGVCTRVSLVDLAVRWVSGFRRAGKPRSARQVPRRERLWRPRPPEKTGSPLLCTGRAMRPVSRERGSLGRASGIEDRAAQRTYLRRLRALHPPGCLRSRGTCPSGKGRLTTLVVRKMLFVSAKSLW